MAAVDDKVTELAFSTTTSHAPQRVAQLIQDACNMAAAGGGKVTAARVGAGRFQGQVKNFVRVPHAEFTVQVTQTDAGGSEVAFAVNDYMRTRPTVLSFIPIGPWEAPAYKPLKKFSEYLQAQLR